MRIQDYVADQTERVAESLAFFLDSTIAERRDWKPTAENGEATRSALQQIGECVVVNGYMAKLIRGDEVAPGLSYDLTFASTEEAQTLLLESAKELAQAIRTLPDADLERDFRHPRAVIRGSNLILMPMRNMAYHAGQINFIQTLYGDSEFHVPPTWR